MKKYRAGRKSTRNAVNDRAGKKKVGIGGESIKKRKA